ncbi:MAG TPA: DUF1622 domain-containing protein [Devosia sp.]|jgi:uncharacterized membrane protein|uniref:DUF1622 domain-containing protein n=1 Tax=Devosia sp. TaxID=1871048 RepID=UPI002F92CD3F
MDDLLVDTLHWVTRAIEVAGILVIVVGCIAAGFRYATDRVHSIVEPSPYHRLRSGIGRSILLGLELLVAADIINTVAIEPTVQSLAVLAGIVLIRTFLSLSLEVEIEGRWPWQSRPAAGEEKSAKA